MLHFIGNRYPLKSKLQYAVGGCYGCVSLGTSFWGGVPGAGKLRAPIAMTRSSKGMRERGYSGHGRLPGGYSNLSCDGEIRISIFGECWMKIREC